MAFPDDLLIYDESNWQAVHTELDRVTDLSEVSKHDFLSCLRMAANNYKLNVNSEKQGPAFRKDGIDFYTKKESAEKSAHDLVFHLKSPGIYGFIGEEKSQELIAQLELFLANSQASHPKSPPPPVGRGANSEYSKYRLALSFAHLWEVFVGGKITANGYGLAELFFIAAGYRSNDCRGDGSPSNMRQLFRAAHKLSTGEDSYLRHYLTPSVLVGKLNAP